MSTVSGTEKGSVNGRGFVVITFFFKILFIYFEREGKGGRKRGEYQCVVASCAPPTGDPAHNLSMCRDWESNQRPPASQSGT